MKTPARAVHTGNFSLDTTQRNGRDAIQRLNGSTLDGAVLLSEEDGKPTNSGLAFSAGVRRTLAHGLGRKAVGLVEVYGVDVPSTAHVGLRASAFPSGVTSDTHISVTPTSTGTCFVLVF